MLWLKINGGEGMKSKEELVVVITGASSGIGMATALELAKLKANLVLVARREDALNGLAEACNNLGATAIALPTDVSIEEHVYSVVERAIQYFGKIDVWINNAAVSIAGHFEEIPMEDFRRVLEINLFGYIYGARAVVPHFKAQGRGQIINVSSMVGITGEPYFSPYAISKFAIRGLGITLNQELYKDNIQVSTVLPSVIDTPIFNQGANYMGKPIKAPGKVIAADEVAHTIVELIEKPKQEVFVGNKGRISAAMKVLLPGLFTRKSEEKIYKEHFETDQETGSTKGNLYDPMWEYATVSGGWMKESDDSSKMKRYAIPATVLTGAAIGLAFYLKNKRERDMQKKEVDIVTYEKVDFVAP